jgi:5-methyltetrahydrofolate--homocysteine methyltransferase
MTHLLDLLQSGVLILMDGAMGTELRRRGMDDDECGELWNCTYPERVRAIHEDYVAAGARCLLTNTFQANPHALACHGAANRLADICAAGLGLAREACPAGGLVLADVGPILQADSSLDFSNFNDLDLLLPWLEQADGVLLETCSSTQALRAAEYLKDRLPGEGKVPVLLSLTYREIAPGDYRTWSGHDPETFARQARQHGVAALGVNCGREIDVGDLAAIVRRYRACTDLPLFARPNAGTPQEREGAWVYPRTPAALAVRLPELVEAGASLIGGCCGTTPKHIAAFRESLLHANLRRMDTHRR